VPRSALNCIQQKSLLFLGFLEENCTASVQIAGVEILCMVCVKPLWPAHNFLLPLNPYSCRIPPRLGWFRQATLLGMALGWAHGEAGAVSRRSVTDQSKTKTSDTVVTVISTPFPQLWKSGRERLFRF
jgi:hypothetical protein